MNICKSCGVTIHEEGKSFCPACEASAREAKEVGFTGDGPEAEKAELSLGDDTGPVTVLKLSQTPDKTGPEGEDTDKVKTEPEAENAPAAETTSEVEKTEGKETEIPAAARPAAEDDRLSFSESPFSAGYASPEAPKEAKDEPATLTDAIEKSGPKNYLTAEERSALLSDLSAARKASAGAAVKEVQAR